MGTETTYPDRISNQLIRFEANTKHPRMTFETTGIQKAPDLNLVAIAAAFSPSPVIITDQEGNLCYAERCDEKKIDDQVSDFIGKHKSKIDSAFPSPFLASISADFAWSQEKACIISASRVELSTDSFYLLVFLNPRNSLVLNSESMVADEFSIYTWRLNLESSKFEFPEGVARTLLEIEKDTIDYQDFYTALSGESLQKFASAIENTINFGRGFRLELMLDLPSGYKWISFSCNSTVDQADKRWLTGLVKDITGDKNQIEERKRIDLWLNTGLPHLEVKNSEGLSVAKWGSEKSLETATKYIGGKRVATIFDFRNQPRFVVESKLDTAEIETAPKTPPIDQVLTVHKSEPETAIPAEPKQGFPDNREQKIIAVNQWLGQSLDVEISAMGIFDGNQFQWKAWWKSPSRFSLPVHRSGSEWLPEIKWLRNMAEVSLEKNQKPEWWSQDLLPFSIPDDHGQGWMVLTDQVSELETTIFAVRAEDEESVREKTRHVVKGLQMLRPGTPVSENLVEKLQLQLNQKELLLKELNHRTKNNLSLATSLLKMQAAYAENEQASVLLRQTQKRLEVIASLHELMYQNPDTSGMVQMDAYLTRLLNGLVEGFGNEDMTLELDLDDVELDMQKANTIGMLVNEIVSNSFKHAFTPKSRSLLKVNFVVKDDLIKLRISDNGPGINYIDQEHNSLGTILIKEFVAQLKGTMEILNGSGTTYLITIKR